MAPAAVFIRSVAIGALVSVSLAGFSPTASAVESSPKVVDPIEGYADARLKAMTLDQEIASLLMVHVGGTDGAALGAYAEATGVGGLILMGDNIPDPVDQLSGSIPLMSADSGLPLLIATDEEGGIVARIPTDDGLAADQLRGLPASATREAFRTRGQLLKRLGIDVNFGVIADVTGDPSSFIYERTLGSDAADASPRVAAAVTGESGAVLSTLKHFPGHGVSPADSHSSIPETGIRIADWRAQHEPPFAAGINAGAEFVMFGHLQFDALDPQPATLSPFWHQVLRVELGFTGIIITDDMNMLQYSGRPDLADQYQNAVRAIAAGNTMLLYVGDVDIPGIVAAVHSGVDAGTITRAQIDDAAHRLLVARRALSTHLLWCDAFCQAHAS